MKKTIIFVHGMFQTAQSWQNWITYFNQKGYHCIAPPWPYHDGEPSSLRQDPPAGLGDLGLEAVVSEIEKTIRSLSSKPIVIGHSVGGLIVQKLANKGLISLGIPVSSVAPNDMLAFDWNFFKTSTNIANPFKGDEPFYMTQEGFYDSFCNTLTKEDAKKAYEQTAVHDSRNVLRDCLLGPGQIDLSLPHVPLLFVTGHEDLIIPHELVAKNFQAYEDKKSITAFKEFPNRSHYICAEPGWEEVAEYVFNWIEQMN